MLITDTNILLRCSQGRTMERVAALKERGIDLATTDRNAEEMMRTLIEKIGLSHEEAGRRASIVLSAFELIDADWYEHLKTDAANRLRAGGKSDWPALAAAMALDAGIWSEDGDYFGVGVPVWSTHNTQFVAADAPAASTNRPPRPTSVA